MSWDVRIIRKHLGRNCYTYNLHEVFYDDEDVPHSFMKDPIDLGDFENIKEARDYWIMIGNAFKKPFLTEEEILAYKPKKEKKKEKPIPIDPRKSLGENLGFDPDYDKEDQWEI